MHSTIDTNSPKPIDENTINVGLLLKEKRESLGFSKQQIADRLRLRVAIIDNIEDNNFDLGQIATFTRGYLRSYAKAVGVDEKLILGALEAVSDVQHKEHRMLSFSSKTERAKHDNNIMKLTWGIFAIILGISAVWWWQNQVGDTLSETIFKPSKQSLEQQSLVTTLDEPTLDRTKLNRAVVNTNNSDNDFISVLPGESSAIDVVDNAESVNTDSVERSNTKEHSKTDMNAVNANVGLNRTDADSKNVANAATVPHPMAETPSSTQVQTSTQTIRETVESRANNILVINYRNDCWTKIEDANGKVLLSNTVKAGKTEQFADVVAPLKITLGAPEGVSMTFGNKAVDLSRYNSGKVARFTLD